MEYYLLVLIKLMNIISSNTKNLEKLSAIPKKKVLPSYEKYVSQLRKKAEELMKHKLHNFILMKA